MNDDLKEYKRWFYRGGAETAILIAGGTILLGFVLMWWICTGLVTPPRTEYPPNHKGKVSTPHTVNRR